MNVQDRLEFAASNFLASTDVTYDECSNGIFMLDRIIVATPSILTADARGYFVPILYAYWERFFRIAFNEYLRCITVTKFRVDEVTLKIAVLRLGRELADISTNHNFKQIHELCQNRTVPEVRKLLKELLNKIESPIDFSASHEWVRTNSNVGYSTLEENCKRFGLDLNALKSNFTMKPLYASLNAFVDARNDIAHGSQFKPLTPDEWNETRDFVLKIMQVVQFELYESLRDQRKVLEAATACLDFSI